MEESTIASSGSLFSCCTTTITLVPPPFPPPPPVKYRHVTASSAFPTFAQEGLYLWLLCAWGRRESRIKHFYPTITYRGRTIITFKLDTAAATYQLQNLTLSALCGYFRPLRLLDGKASQLPADMEGLAATLCIRSSLPVTS